MSDTFTTPDQQVERDRWGRPLITPPGGGKARGYTRVTTLVSVLEDTYNLGKWQMRMVAKGLTLRDDLLLQASSLDPEDKDDKRALDALVQDALDAAKAGSKAITGTALHRLTEIVDAGQPLPDGVPQAGIDAIDAYRRATEGFEHLTIEQLVVNDDLEAAGTPDRIAVVDPDSPARIVDLKGLSLDTPLPTADPQQPWTTMGSVRVGDWLLDEAGRPTQVTAKSRVKHLPCYEVRFDDGTSIVCDHEHLWWTRRPDLHEDEPVARPVTELARSVTHGGRPAHLVPTCGPLDLPPTDLPVNPYVLGVWLAAGHELDGLVTTNSDVLAVLKELDEELVQVETNAGPGHSHEVVGLRGRLAEAGVLDERRIPDVVLRGSLADRLLVLRGMMDASGSCEPARGRATLHTADADLATSFHELATSLGCLAQPWPYDGSDPVRFTSAVLGVRFSPTFDPFHVRAGQMPTLAATDRPVRSVVAVRAVDPVPTACIQVDSPTSTFLCGWSMVPTHNTGNVEWGRLKMAMQLAVYANSQSYDVATGERAPLDVDTETGVIVHLDPETFECQTYDIDLTTGWKAVQTAVEVRQWRKVDRPGCDLMVPRTQGPSLLSLVATARDVAELERLWRTNRDVWNDDLTKAATERKKELVA